MYQIMDPTLEIRKLPPTVIRELAQILDYAGSWKKLMEIIPQKLDSNCYVCDIKPNNLQKYSSEDIKIIENGRELYKRSCTEILFDEWGTSGRSRATLGHLKYLLTKAQLFRAADYVAKLLNEDLPARPNSGPAAKVPLGMSQVIPEIIVSDVENVLNKINNATINGEEESSNYSCKVSDMMKFSNDLNEELPEIGAEVPELTVLLQNDQEQQIESPSIIPAFSKILNNPDNQNEEAIPSFSQLLDDHQEQTCDNVPNSNLIPNLSLLKYDIEKTSDLIPDFDILQSKTSQNSNTSNSTDSIALTGSNKCPSPLPILSLNTQLPHFTYVQLEAATNNFSERPFISENEEGRFLGSGAFGSVFLSFGLLKEPVAVKRIFLQNVEIVNEDDEVTKQFKNEVEILSKYKHENLVSLIGYSCDGCTYCLVYEYVPGGALFDFLEKTPQKLSWKQRIKIALGTAKAVAYLHTALSVPLIHRDIKTANILLDASHNPKLCDFGIVKLLPNQKTDMQTTLYGTSAYMSPEYHRGDVSIKLDTFSFGVVLLELMTSLPPLDYNRQGADLVTYFEDNCEGSFEPILDKSVGTWEENGINFATELYSLTVKCLEDKKKRPIMIEIVEELEQIMKNINLVQITS